MYNLGRHLFGVNILVETVPYGAALLEVSTTSSNSTLDDFTTNNQANSPVYAIAK